MAKLRLLVAELGESGQEQGAVEGGDLLVRLDGERRREDERAIGADLDVRRALSLLFGGEQGAGRSGALEVEPFTGRDDVRAGQWHDELGQRRLSRRSLAGAEPREHAHCELDRRRPVLGRDDLHGPMAVERLERVRRKSGGRDRRRSHVGGSAKREERASAPRPRSLL